MRQWLAGVVLVLAAPLVHAAPPAVRPGLDLGAGYSFREKSEQRTDAGGGRVVLTLLAPDPASPQSRQLLNVGRAARFPLWGHTGPDPAPCLWSADGEFSLRFEAPAGDYLLSLLVGEFDEGESLFELSVGPGDGAAQPDFYGPMPEGAVLGRPFGVYRVVRVENGKPLAISLKKRRFGSGDGSQGAGLIAVHLLPLAEARRRAGGWLDEAQRVFGNPFYYPQPDLPKGRMLQVIDLTERARAVLTAPGAGAEKTTLDHLHLLAFEARYWMALETRYGKLSDDELLAATRALVARIPDHAHVRRYLSSWALRYPNASGGMLDLPLLLSLRYRLAGEPWDAPGTADESAPGWASSVLTVNAKLGQLTDYWVNRRQREDGQLGGRLDDDVEVMRQLRLPAMTGNGDAVRGFRRISEAMYATGQIKDGYLARYRDVEHSAEYVTDALCPTILHDYPDEKTLARLEQSARCVTNWVAPNPRGRHLFKSVYFDARGFSTDPANTSDVPRGRADMVTDGFDCPYNIQAAGPALWWLWHKDDPDVRAALTRWLRSWHDIASQPWHNRPAGVYPAVIKWSDEAQACLGGTDFLKPQAGFDYYSDWQGNFPWMQLALAMYYVTDDRQFLDMIEDSLRWVRDHEKDRRKLGRVYDTLREQCAWMYPYWRAETGRDTYDQTFADEASWAAVGPVSGWKDAVESQRWVLDYTAGRVLDHTKYNFAMFTREVVYTDRVYVRGLTELEPTVYGLPANRGFALPLFRATFDCPPAVACSALITRKDRLAVLAYNAAADPQALTVRPVHLPPGEYTLSTYDPAKLDEPAARRRANLARRPEPVGITLPAKKEQLLVFEQVTAP